MCPSPPEIAEAQRRKRLGFRMEIDGLREGVKSEWRLTRWEGLRAEVMAASTSSLVTPIASSPPLRRWAQVERRDGQARRRHGLASGGEPLYLLLSGFQKLFLLSTVAIFCCSSKSPSGLGIEYLGDLYGWKILYYIRLTLPSYNLQVTDDSGLRRCTFFISTTAFLSKHSRWYDISKLSDPDQTLRQQILRTQYRFCSESCECVTCQLVTQVT